MIALFEPEEPVALADVTSATAYAIERPLDSKPLSRMIRKGDKVAIITENQFRAAPADLMLPPILETVRKAGGTPTIVIGCGKVPALTPEEIEHKLGKGILGSGIPVICNDVSKPEDYTYLGITSRGVPLFVLRAVAEADVRISIATTQATLWGYGGSGMIIPAVSGNETTEMNHMFSLPAIAAPEITNATCRKTSMRPLLWLASIWESLQSSTTVLK